MASILVLSVFLSILRKAPQVGCVNLRHRTLVLHDLHCAVQRAFVLVSFQTLSEGTHTAEDPWQQLELWRPWPLPSTHLHPGLDDVEGSVPEDAGGSSDGSERTRYHGVNGSVGVVALVIHKKKSFWCSIWVNGVCCCRFTHTFVPVPQHSHDVEADGLVGALLQHRGRQTLIRPLQS